MPANASPLIEYGLPDGRAVANFWTYTGRPTPTRPQSATNTWGTDPTNTVNDLRRLIGDRRR